MSRAWGDWETAASKLPGFIEWAEPTPTSSSDERYAIVRSGAIAWARVSPNPNSPVELSSGRFYDTGDPNDHPEGAVEWCRRAAVLHKARIARMLDTCDACGRDCRCDVCGAPCTATCDEAAPGYGHEYTSRGGR